MLRTPPPAPLRLNPINPAINVRRSTQSRTNTTTVPIPFSIAGVKSPHRRRRSRSPKHNTSPSSPPTLRRRLLPPILLPSVPFEISFSPLPTPPAIESRRLEHATKCATCTLCFETVDRTSALGTNGCRCQHPVCSECFVSARYGVMGKDYWFNISISRSKSGGWWIERYTEVSGEGEKPYLNNCHMCMLPLDNHDDDVVFSPLSWALKAQVEEYLLFTKLTVPSCDVIQPRKPTESRLWPNITRLLCPLCKDPTYECCVMVDRDGTINFSKAYYCKNHFVRCTYCTDKPNVSLFDLKDHMDVKHPLPELTHAWLTTEQSAKDKEPELELEVEGDDEDDDGESDLVDTQCCICGEYTDDNEYTSQYEMESIKYYMCEECNDLAVTENDHPSVMRLEFADKPLGCSFCLLNHGTSDDIWPMMNFKTGVAKDEGIQFMCGQSVEFMLRYITGEKASQEFPFVDTWGLCYSMLKKYIPDPFLSLPPSPDLKKCNICHKVKPRPEVVDFTYLIQCHECFGSNNNDLSEHHFKRVASDTLQYCYMCDITHFGLSWFQYAPPGGGRDTRMTCRTGAAFLCKYLDRAQVSVYPSLDALIIVSRIN